MTMIPSNKFNLSFIYFNNPKPNSLQTISNAKQIVNIFKMQKLLNYNKLIMKFSCFLKFKLFLYRQNLFKILLNLTNPKY